VLPLRYPLRSLWVRRARAALTVGVIALVVLSLALLSGLVTSLKRSLESAGSPRNLIVLRKGATSDGGSALPLEVYQALRFFDGVARGPDGEPLVSPELVVQPFATTREGGRESAQVRGVEAAAFALRDEVTIREGRRLRPSSGEAIVGSAAAARYAGAELGGELALGHSRWRVVGVFEAGGSALDAEIWVDARQLASDAKRPSPYSSLRLRVADGADVSALRRRIEDDPRFTLAASVESEYYAKQAASADALYWVVGVLAALAGVGAAFGATNTLFAAVQARTREIGTLRALGFSRASIAAAFLLESALIALAGFALGAALASLGAGAISALVGDVPMFGADGTSLIALRVGSRDLAASLALALAIGVGGAFFPARRAARLRPIEALRKA
jgi:ABC-type lipoprotein release transport system permease subunit